MPAPSNTSPSRPKPRAQHGIYLQPRDYALFAALSDARVLPVEAMEWLFYPDWRDRYRQYHARVEAGAKETYYPTPNLYRRLRVMRDATPPLLYCYARTADQARLLFPRLSDCYALTKRGAGLLCDHTGCDIGEVTYERDRTQPIKNLEHCVAIGRFYAALRAQLEHTGRTLRGWQGDFVLARSNPDTGPNYDRLAVTGYHKPLPVLPDATFLLDGVRYFVEIDRSTSPVATWRKKAKAYDAYRRSAALRRRYGVDDFVVLVVVPSRVRLNIIAKTVLTSTGNHGADHSYRYLLADCVHPTYVRGNWYHVTGSAWTTERVLDKVYTAPTAITFTLGKLWSSTNPTEKPSH